MKSKALWIGLASFLLGVFCLFGALKWIPNLAPSLLGERSVVQHKPIESALDLRQSKPEEQEEAMAPPSFKDSEEDEDDFFAPFVQARQLQQQMEKEMRKGMAGAFQGANSEQNIVKKEDAHSVSYEIKGVEGSSLNTSVQNGYLTISGMTKSESAHVSFQSSFHRMFPLPPNVDSAKMETLSEKDKVVLRFPKKQG